MEHVRTELKVEGNSKFELKPSRLDEFRPHGRSQFNLWTFKGVEPDISYIIEVSRDHGTTWQKFGEYSRRASDNLSTDAFAIQDQGDSTNRWRLRKGMDTAAK